MNKNLNFKKQITEKCKIACMNLYRIKNIRQYLTLDACKVLVLGLVIVHLDYANSIYSGLPNKDMLKLQRIQNLAAKMILGKSKTASSTQALKVLHWLPVDLRIEYKILVTVFKCLHDMVPEYLMRMIEKRERMRNTHMGSDNTLLNIPQTKKKTFADRGFRVTGPRLWNSLP